MATPEEVDAAGAVGIEIDTLVDKLGTARITRYADTSYDVGRAQIEPGDWYHMTSGRSRYDYGLMRVTNDGVVAFTRDEVGVTDGELLPDLNGAIRYLIGRRTSQG
ncbi:hypothetical protein [Agromyces sp. GXQ0307]|uniref:hypothetical protein n=1 Tax=Agromyces sp. GXQ0307 TaxID=3377835 RepID=UPI00383AFA90